MRSSAESDSFSEGSSKIPARVAPGPQAATRMLAVVAALRAERNRLRDIRIWIFIYAAIWLFEGALRRWVLPGALSDAFLFARDPIALWIYFLAWRQRIFPWNPFVVAALVISSLALLLTLVAGHGNPIVAAIGFRTDFFHIPLIFVTGRCLTANDVEALTRIVLILAIPVTLIMVLQFLSPQTAWINRGIGGEGTAGFSGAEGRFRPPGTFSFITGPSVFYPFVTACVFAVLASARRSVVLAAMGGAAVLLAAGVSISRSLVLASGLSAVVGVFALLRRGMLRIGMIVQSVAAIGVAVVLAAQIPAFKEGISAFSSRWTDATVQQGGVKTAILDRALADVTGPIRSALDLPLFGYGIGYGTNAGAKLLTGKRDFLAGEGDWTRHVNELGLVFGLAFIGVRIAILAHLGLRAFRAFQAGNVLPMVLLSACALPLLQGQWAQATIQGFACLAGGVVLAATRQMPDDKTLNRLIISGITRDLNDGSAVEAGDR